MTAALLEIVFSKNMWAFKNNKGSCSNKYVGQISKLVKLKLVEQTLPVKQRYVEPETWYKQRLYGAGGAISDVTQGDIDGDRRMTTTVKKTIDEMEKFSAYKSRPDESAYMR